MREHTLKNPSIRCYFGCNSMREKAAIGCRAQLFNSLGRDSDHGPCPETHRMKCDRPYHYRTLRISAPQGHRLDHRSLSVRACTAEAHPDFLLLRPAIFPVCWKLPQGKPPW